jgi:hypothetical protein
MTHPHATQDLPDPDLAHSKVSKYEHEAEKVHKLLAHDPEAAAARLRVDGKMAPHELHKFFAELKKDCKDLPNVTITDDDNGINVSVKKGETKKPTDIFKRNAEDLGKEKEIPQIAQLLKLTEQETDRVLKTQEQEKDALYKAGKKDLLEKGKGFHSFVDIAVSLGYCTPEDAHFALRHQDQLRAQELATDLSKGMPLLRGEGPYQMLKRTHPEIPDEVAAHYAHLIKKLNGGEREMRVGQELIVLPPDKAQQLAGDLYNSNQLATGDVKAQAGQSLADVPVL